ncbi:MAG: hypothetical protein ACI861_001180 [Paracoccaceae bacterium]|jgi:hypothetical protein
MTRRAQLFWVLVGLTVIVYGALGYTSGIVLRQMSGGLLSFDFRSAGYSYAEAQAFLSSLTPAGTEYYLNTVLRIDAVFPALLTMVLAIIILHLTQVSEPLLRAFVAVPPFAYAGFDYWENALVRQMLQFPGDQLPETLVSLASGATMSKFVALVVSAVIVFGLLVLRRRKLA